MPRGVDPEVLYISKEAAASPAYGALRTHFQQLATPYNSVYNPGGKGMWMQFLSKYRKTQPKVHSLKEGAALVKRAGALYRKQYNRNPSDGDDFSLSTSAGAQGRIGLGLPEAGKTGVIVVATIALIALKFFSR